MAIEMPMKGSAGCELAERGASAGATGRKAERKSANVRKWPILAV